MDHLHVLDAARTVLDLTSMLHMALNTEVPDPGLVMDRMRRLDDAQKRLRETMAAWVVSRGLDTD